MRACAGSCSEETVVLSIVDIETGLMPAFMTLDAGVLTVVAMAPEDSAEDGEYEMQITMSTPDSGDQVYETVTVVLDVCVITHIDAPSDVTTLDLHYLIFALEDLSIDLQDPSLSILGFQQVPACGYYLIEEFTWTIPDGLNGDGGTPIVQNTDPAAGGDDWYVLTVASTTPGHHGTYSLQLDLTGTYPTLGTVFEQSVAFDVVIEDPCRTTEFVAFTIPDITIQAGQTHEELFEEPEQSAGQAVSDQSICGTLTYQILKFSATDLAYTLE